MSAPSPYVHGTSAPEQARLSALNDLLNPPCLRALALRGGERILDVGCGLGQFARALAERAALVVGVERSLEQLRHARAEPAPCVDWRQGEATALPLAPEEWGTFDVAHARFVLEHVSDPLAVVRQMVAAVRPGGRIVLADDDHDVLRLCPEPAGFRPAWQAYVRTYDRLGNDPFVGRRLVELLHAAGAEPRRNDWLFFGSCVGQASFATLLANLHHILVGARDLVLAQHLLPANCYDAALGALQAWGSGPDAAIWYAVCWAEGARPG